LFDATLLTLPWVIGGAVVTEALNREQTCPGT
jgi:hypothetical protein